MAKTLRNDITGLRAIAVISVTLYHILHTFVPQFNFMQGGFVGVDIFFVISGYLMTKIIVDKLYTNNFNLYDFYAKRAKRICPALFVTILIFIALAYFLVSPNDMSRMSTEAAYALVFLSNIYFASKTDYFAASALDQPFLHTWSLAVEWQFYIFYPLVLMLLVKLINLAKLKQVILLLTICGYAFAIFYTNYNAKSSYFMLTSRAFELLFGALAYFYPLKFKFIAPKYLEAIGLSLIMVAIILLNADDNWPTAYTLLPVAATYICIAANNHNSLLSNVVFQKLGLYSYSIYLVHWPLIVFSSKIGLEDFYNYIIIPILILSLILFYAVENKRTYAYKFCAIYFVLFAISITFSNTGAKWRYDTNVSYLSSYGGRFIDHNGKLLILNEELKDEVDFILAGDSFARHYARDLQERFLKVATVFDDGCYSYANYVSIRPEGIIKDSCRNRYANLVETIKAYPDKKIVIAQDWPRYERALVSRATDTRVGVKGFKEAIAEDLKSLHDNFADRQIYIVLTPYQSVFDIGASCMYLSMLDNPLAKFLAKNVTCKPYREIRDAPLNKFLLSQISKYDNFIAIDPNVPYCNGTNCRVVLDNNLPVYQDGLHYSIIGSKEVVSHILSVINLDNK